MTELALPQRLTLAEAAAAARELGAKAAAVRAAATPLVIDARGLQTFDSSAFAVMLDVARKAHARGGVVTVRGAPQSMVDLAKLYGVDAMLTFA